MTYFPSRLRKGLTRPRSPFRLRLACALLAAVAGIAHAQLAEWVRHVESGSILRDAFFRTVSLPSGAIRVERTPAETRAALSLLVGQSPGEASLYALRAHEAERQLDFISAEADWKRHAGLAADRTEWQLALADYYHRRLQPQEEVSALLGVGAAPSAAHERFIPVNEQRSWTAFERILSTADAQAFPIGDRVRYLQAWQQRYPNERSVHQKLFNFLLESEQFTAARNILEEYTRTFPGDAVFPTQAEAALTRAEGSEETVLSFYEREFQPLWPQALIQDYYTALQKAGRLRSTLDQVNTRLRQGRRRSQGGGMAFPLLPAPGERRLGSRRAPRLPAIERSPPSRLDGPKNSKPSQDTLRPCAITTKPRASPTRSTVCPADPN